MTLSSSPSKPPPLRLYIIRHGETDENVNGIIQGQLDTELNETGRLQSRRVADALRTVPFKYAFCSNLQRAEDTAKIIVARHAGLELQPTEGLKERFMGSMEGVHASIMGRHLPADAEPSLVFQQRCLKWWDDCIIPIAKNSSGENEVNILIVTHGAYISGLIRGGLASRNYRGGPFRGPLYNTSISVVLVDSGGKKGEVMKYGDIMHLLTPTGPNNADAVGNEDEDEAEAVSEP